MKTTFFKVVAVLACLCMVAGAFVGCNSEKKSDEIVIGLSGPLTGGAAVYGTAVKNAAQMAVDEINAEAEANGGLKLKLIALDDQHDATKVETNYAAMMDQGMQVSLGCVTTNPCLEFAAFAKEDNVFFLTPSASANDVAKNSNAYQMCFADGNQGSVAANYVNTLSYEKIGIFYKSDDNYSKGIYDQFKATLNKSIKTVDAAFTGDASDFTQQIENLKDCKFIFMPIYYTPASNFMMQAKGKIADDAIYYGCDGFDGLASAEGFDINDIPQSITMLSHFDSNAKEGKAKEFADKYVAKFGKDTLNQFGASAYDCVYAIYAAMNKAIKAGKTINASTSASDLCNILKDQFNNGFTFENGATGASISWGADGFVKKDAAPVSLK